MRFPTAGAVALALTMLTVTGCGFRLPGAMGPTMTPDEMRQRHGEGAKYMLEAPEQAPGTAASSSQPAPSTGRYQVAPELIGQPPVRQAAARPAAIPADAPPSSRYGDLLFISGQLPVDARSNTMPAGFEQQARAVMENVRAVLEANRLSMANVVSMTVYLQDLNDVKAFDAVYASYFKGAQPARSVVEVSRLPRNAKIEVAAVAGR